jgi:hypothetical protein
MSHTPTIHPTPDGHVEIRVDGLQVAVLPDRDAETLGQELADLYGLAGAATPVQVCATCDGPLEWATHPDRGQGGWRHLTGEPGPVHAAHPARTDTWVSRAHSALGHFGGPHLDRTTAARLLSCWAHRRCLSTAQLASVLATYPAIGGQGMSQPPGCPPWCTTDHTQQQHWHHTIVTSIPNPEAGPGFPVEVSLFELDGHPTVIGAERADTMRPQTTLELVAALLRAVLAGGAS